MKNTYLLLLFLTTTSFLAAQEYSTLAAKIIDAKTNLPVEFVNVGFLDRGIGTVSDSFGNFKLNYKTNRITGDDILQISSIGYETKIIYFYELKELNSYEFAISLVPKEYGLAEVLLTSEKREFERLGKTTYAKSRGGYWRDLEGLGGEIATKVNINHRNTLLHDLSFNIQENLSDSLLVRVKIYDYHRGFPGKELLYQNIFHVISKKKGVETIPLKDYNIVVDKNIVVSLELVEIYGDIIYFSVSASPYGGLSFTKKLSQDTWRAYEDIGISYNLISSYSKQFNATTVARKKPEKIQVFWDTSMALQERNTKDELKLLSKYLKKLGNVNVEVIKFNNGEHILKTFECIAGDSEAIVSYLEDSYYLGATDYSQIVREKNKEVEAVLLFTNGKSVLSSLEPEISAPIFTVNSFANANHQSLQNAAIYSGGHYINLDKSSIKEGLDFLLNDIEDKHSYDPLDTKDKRGFVYGVIYDENGPVQDATVEIKDTFVQATTGPNGRYVIDAQKGDLLSVKAFGRYTKDTIVSRIKKLHIPLEGNVVVLNEVKLKEKIDVGAEIVDTPFGKKKRGSVGFSTIRRFTEKDILPTHLYWYDVLIRLPGVILVRGGYAIRKTMRSSFLNGGLGYPAIVVDDMIYDQNAGQFPPPMDMQTIKSIVVLSTPGSTVRYGQLAAYGAIVVELKKPEDYDRNLTQAKPKKELTKRPKYTEKTTTIEIAQATNPKSDLLLALENTADVNAAKKRYANQLQTIGTPSISYLIEASSYFQSKDLDFAKGVVSTIAHLAPDNSKALKTLAYQHEKLGNYKDAHKIYNRLLRVNNRDVQSYLDYARSLKQIKEYKEAGDLYAKMMYNQIPEIDFTAVAEMINSETRQLVSLHKSKINFQELPNVVLTNYFSQDIRMVFDWNDAATDFELQFVDPDNNYFTYSHTVFENGEEVAAEIKDGIASKEFVLNNPTPGKWLINVNPLGEKETKNATFIKYTLYRNYGKPNETKTIKLIDLSKYEKKITVDSFVY